MQDQQQRKKVSVGEALERMRESQPAQAPKTSIVGLGAAYWLESLIEGATRRQADLFESIRENPSAQAQMQRRDLRVAGELSVPASQIQEIRQPKAARPTRPATGLRERFANVGELRLDNVKLELVATERKAPLTPAEEAVESVVSRFQDVSTLDLAAFYAVEEVGSKPQPEAKPPSPGTVSLSRFPGISEFDIHAGSIEMVEVRQAPVDELPKRRLKTNPNIRKMFQQNDPDQ
ncbi:MAG: hypothetical protein AB1758_21925 [Candidatus Eremiobacterota bacterium]